MNPTGESPAPRSADALDARSRHHRSSSRFIWLVLGFLVGLAISAGAFWVYLIRQAPPVHNLLHFTIDLPEGNRLDSRAVPLAISPDGSKVAFAARSSGITSLFVRLLDQSEARPVPHTEGASNPFFSPDGRWIGYFNATDSKLMKAPLAGGIPVAVCDAGAGAGACWAPDGTIFFAPDALGGLFQVAGGGGAPAALTRPSASESGHRWPSLLPGGETLLFTAGMSGTTNGTKLIALSLETGERRVLMEGAAFAHYMENGHLLYLRGGKCLVQPFDPHRLEFRGPAVTVLPEIWMDPPLWAAHFALSQTGALVYASNVGREALNSLVWAYRNGMVERISIHRGVFSYPRLSPDGSRLALIAASPEGISQVCIMEGATGKFRRLPTEGNSAAPLWTPDGHWITYASDRDGRWSLYMIPADEHGAASQLLRGEHPQLPTSWSSDGRYLCYTELNPVSGADIWILSPRENRRWPLLQRNGGDWGGEFSPDGRWIAYVSDEGGTSQVMLQPFPGPGRAYQISTIEGAEPAWSRDGRELFYRYLNRLMSAAIPQDGSLPIDAPQLIIEGRFASGAIAMLRNYDVAPDGGRFAMIRGDDESARTLHIQYDWMHHFARSAADRNSEPKVP